MKDLNKFKNEMNLSGKNVYVGHRYVPKVMGDWDNTNIYEPLSIVQYQGNSFTSRQYVPSGIEITNEEYWASTGNYNAQIEQYRQDVRNLESDVNYINDEVISARNGEENLKDRLDKDKQEVTTNLSQIAMSVLNFGAVGDGVHDDRPAIQEGIDYLKSVGGGTLFFPKGYTFLLNSKTYVSDNVIIGLKNGVSLDGKGTIKIADNFGDYHSIFNLSEIVSNVSYKNITVDENTRGNPMVNLPDSKGDAMNTRTTFFLWKRGSKNVKIENVVIDDCLGVWQITSGRIHNFIVKNNTINFSKITPDIKYDRTSIYFGAVGAELSGNVLNGSDFANTAIELHGDNILVFNNRVYEYVSFMFIVNDGEIVEKVNNIKVYNNIGKTKGGITLWFEEDNINVDNVEIYDNTFYVQTRNVLQTYDIIGENVTVKNIVFKDNEIFAGGVDRVFSFTCTVTPTDSIGIKYEKITVKGNNIHGNAKTFLLLERSQKGNNDYFIIEDLKVCDNSFNGTCTYGVQVTTLSDSFKHAVVENNEFNLTNFSGEIAFLRHDSEITVANPLIFKNNNFTNIIPKKLVEYTGSSLDFIVKQELKSIELTNKNINTSKMTNGSVLYDIFGNTISKENDKWVISKKTGKYPVHEYLTQGSILWLTNSSDNIAYKVKNNGYVPDHDVATGTHKKGDWVSYGIYVAEVLIDNSISDYTNVDENVGTLFKYLGEKLIVNTI